MPDLLPAGFITGARQPETSNKPERGGPKKPDEPVGTVLASISWKRRALPLPDTQLFALLRHASRGFYLLGFDHWVSNDERGCSHLLGPPA